MDYQLLASTQLFGGIATPELQHLMGCVQGVSRRYSKGEVLCHMGEPMESAGLVLSGEVHIEQDDIWGNQNILSTAGPGEMFAEAYACVPGESLMVNVIAAKDCEVLFINTHRMLRVCQAGCDYHNRLIQNLVQVIAQKNLNLTRKIGHTAPKSIRGRVLSYLSYQATRLGSRSVEIPFSRQQLADYLCVDRSALSAELSRMQKDGLLQYHKNHFQLTPASLE